MDTIEDLYEELQEAKAEIRRTAQILNDQYSDEAFRAYKDAVATWDKAFIAYMCAVGHDKPE